ncbi:DNA topoisomerase I [Aphelenchoides bicaudatus]|nr:DNA topoisomerase I [Aphelenchoides bicaudatus]
MAEVASPNKLSNGISNGMNGSPKKEQDDSLINGNMLNNSGDEQSDDDVPWSARLKTETRPDSKTETDSGPKSPIEEEDDDYEPVVKQETPPKPDKKIKKQLVEKKRTEFVEIVPEPKSEKRKKDKSKEKRKSKPVDSDSEQDDYEPESKKSKKKSKTEVKIEKKKKGKEVEVKVTKRKTTESQDSPNKKKKKVEQEEEVWRWWEEEKKADGVKWNSLEHKGPLFAPAYERIPKEVKFKYDGSSMTLSKDAEEVASFYAKMLDHEYTSKDSFNKNFFKDWRKTMTQEERDKITDLKKCDFKAMHTYFTAEAEKRRNMSKDEKKAIKDEKDAETKVYGFAFIDGHKQKIGNFRIEPPGLFRGRGDHPKMGKLKKRIQPEDVTINCSKGSKPPTPPEGHKWKEIRHDNTVTWLCSWSENVLGNNKYIMLNPSSKIKGEKDYEKFETARRLKGEVKKIRKEYTEEFKHREMRIRQRAVALYLIDKLALRAGNEKDTDEAADTVGCCSLRCEHIKLHKELDGNKYMVEFDFLGKDSIRYQNTVKVEKTVFKNLKIFKEDKTGSDDLFDRLDTSTLNAHLRSLMPGLTAKVFRTFNASNTLQEQLIEETEDDMTVPEKMLAYNRANRKVAILCNHQRAVPKTHEKSMENLETKISEKQKEAKEVKRELKDCRNSKEREKLEKKRDRIKDQLKRLEIQRTDKDENKQIALGTSKLNYLDPRISVAWCKKYNVPIEKVFNKTQREKFRWAIDMADEDYEF